MPVPVISIIIGEGCSGGALAMCATDYVGMLENSYLSVIAPEACASIIFRDPSRAAEAAEALKLTAADMKGRGIVDEIIPEPLGGAHNDPTTTIEAVGKALNRVLTGLSDTTRTSSARPATNATVASAPTPQRTVRSTRSSILRGRPSTLVRSHQDVPRPYPLRQSPSGRRVEA